MNAIDSASPPSPYGTNRNLCIKSCKARFHMDLQLFMQREVPHRFTNFYVKQDLNPNLLI